MLSPLLVHFLIPLWKSTTTLSAMLRSSGLWNELTKELRQPVDDESLSLSSHDLSLTGSSSSSSSSSSLSVCNTPSLFHSRLKTYLFHKSFSSVPPSRHYWYKYIPKTTQECTFWSCLQLTIAGAPGQVVQRRPTNLALIDWLILSVVSLTF